MYIFEGVIKRHQMKAEEEEFYKFLGNKIALQRKRLGITQEKLGEALELSRVSVVNIEKGKQKLSIYQLYIITEKLNITPDSLILGYQSVQKIPITEIVQGRELDEKSLMEFNIFLNKIKK